MTEQTDDSREIAYLGFIQGVISRLGGNSASIKGWAAAAFFAVLALDNRSCGELNHYIMIFLPMAVVIFFWLLDSYYLWLERRYRELYNAVAEVYRDSDANSKFTPKLFSMTRLDEKSCFWNKLGDYLSAMFKSFPNTVFYLVPLVAAIGLIFLK